MESHAHYGWFRSTSEPIHGHMAGGWRRPDIYIACIRRSDILHIKESVLKGNVCMHISIFDLSMGRSIAIERATIGQARLVMDDVRSLFSVDRAGNANVRYQLKSG